MIPFSEHHGAFYIEYILLGFFLVDVLYVLHTVLYLLNNIAAVFLNYTALYNNLDAPQTMLSTALRAFLCGGCDNFSIEVSYIQDMIH